MRGTMPKISYETAGPAALSACGGNTRTEALPVLARTITITPEKVNGEWFLHYRLAVGDTFVMDGTARTMGDAVGRIVSFAVDGGLLREYEWEKPPASRHEDCGPYNSYNGPPEAFPGSVLG